MDIVNHKFIPLSVPNLKGRELEYVTHTINSEWVSSGGSYVNEFENELANYVTCKGAVSCQNGTSGLHIALKVCGVTEDDEVIVPTLTFIAAVNPVKYVGAEPVFMDCDDSLTMDTEKLNDFCEKECKVVDGKLINNSTHRHIKALIVVHVFGNMADMETIIHIAHKYNLMVIEDATEALGTYYLEGRYKGKHAGTIGDIGIYSFNGNKIITTGGGGMLVSHNDMLLKKAKHLTTQAKSDELYCTHDEIGYNYRMTNIQAALGLAQLEQLEKFIGLKKANYDFYRNEIEEITGLRLLEFNNRCRPNYWFYSLYIEAEYALNRDEAIDFLHGKRIQARPIWALISDQKPYIMNQTYMIEKAREYLDSVINIPCSSNLVREDVKYVIECLKQPELL